MKQLLMLCSLMLVLIACQRTSNVVGIQINPGNGFLNLNTSREYSAVAQDANGTALQVTDFIWTSSDPSIASVSGGQVTGLKLGSSQIIASAKGVTSAPVTVTVIAANNSLSLSAASDLVPVLLLSKRLLGSLGVNPAKFTFPSPPLSDLELAPFGVSGTPTGDTSDPDSDGLPTEATITYSGSFKRGTQPALTYSGSIHITDANNTNSTSGFNAEIKDLKLEGTLIGQAYKYTLNAQQTLRSNSTGNGSMTLRSTGTLTLNAFGRSSKLEFAINAQYMPDDLSTPLAGGALDWQDATVVTVNNTTTSILTERGEGVHLGCGYDAGRSVTTDANNSLLLLEFGPGCDSVQFSRDGGVFEPGVAGIYLEPSPNLTLTLGASKTMTVNVMDAAGRGINNSVGWASNNPNVVSVDQSGNVKALAVGTASIAASSGNKTVSSTVIVTSPTLSSITIAPVGAALKYGQSQLFTATATTTTGDTFTLQTGTVTWASSNPTVAAISATTGLLTAQNIAGSTNITASAFGKVSSPVVVSVSAPAVASISVTPLTASILVGGTQQFTAIAKDAGGVVIPGVTFTWASSILSAASIGTTGLATGVAAGFSNITATAGSITSNTAVLNVTDFTLTSTSTPLVLSVVRPALVSADFTVTITPVNGFVGTPSYALDGAIIGSLPPVGVSLVTVLAGNPTTLNVGVAATVPAGTYSLNVVATSGTLKHAVPITLTVTGP